MKRDYRKADIEMGVIAGQETRENEPGDVGKERTVAVQIKELLGLLAYTK